VNFTGQDEKLFSLDMGGENLTEVDRTTKQQLAVRLRLPAPEPVTVTIDIGEANGSADEPTEHTLKMRRITDVRQLAALQRICHVDKPEDLGSGKDFQRYGEKQNAGYGPKVIGAWVIDNPALKVGYKGSRMLVSSACTKVQPSPVHLRPKFEQAVQELLGSMENRHGILSEPLNSSINEKFLLHSPNMDAAHAIIENGFNEHFAGTSAGAAYGEGCYFAEDVAKTDQYAKLDNKYNDYPDLHR
jgi:hypothetical protein